MFKRTKILPIEFVLPFLFLSLFFFFTLGYFFSTRINFGLMPYDFKRILQLLLLVMFNGFFVVSPRYRLRAVSLFCAFPLLMRAILAIILCVGVVSSILAARPYFAFLELSLYILLFLFFINIATLYLDQPKYFERIMMGIVVFSAILYLITFAIDTRFQSASFTLFLLNFPGFMNIRFFSQYQGWTLGIILMPLFLLPSRFLWCRWVLFFIASLWFLLFLVNFPKGLLLGYLFALLIVCVGFKKQRHLIIRWHIKLLGMMVFFIGVFIAIIFLFHQNPLVAHYLYPPSNFLKLVLRPQVSALFSSDFLSRIAFYRLGIKLVLQHPILGVGPMHYAYYTNRLTQFVAHPHNSIILIGSEWGLIVLGLLLLMGARLYSYWFRFASQSSSYQLGLLTISLTASLLYSLFSGVFVTPLSQIMFMVVLGWMVGVYYAEEKNLKSVSPGFWLGWSLLLMLPFLFLIVFVLPGLSRLPYREIYWIYHNSFHVQSFFPRFWVQGIIHL